MPTLKEIYNNIEKLEKLDPSEGAYPIFFKDDYTKLKYIMYCRYRNFIKRILK